jgi:hypothetical protein
VGFIVKVVLQFRRGDGWQVVAIDVPVLIVLAAAIVLAVQLAWRRRVKRYQALAQREGWDVSAPRRWNRDWTAEFTGRSGGLPFVTKVHSEGAYCRLQLPVWVPYFSVDAVPPSRGGGGAISINGMRVLVGDPARYGDHAVRQAAAFAQELLTSDVVFRTRTNDLSSWSIGGTGLGSGWSGRISNPGLVDLIRSVGDLAATLPPAVLSRYALTDSEVAARETPRARPT